MRRCSRSAGWPSLRCQYCSRSGTEKVCGAFVGWLWFWLKWSRLILFFWKQKRNNNQYLSETLMMTDNTYADKLHVSSRISRALSARNWCMSQRVSEETTVGSYLIAQISWRQCPIVSVWRSKTTVQNFLAGLIKSNSCRNRCISVNVIHDFEVTDWTGEDIGNLK